VAGHRCREDGEADVAVSAGNTGALMAMSKFCLRMMATIERPAIAGIWPTLRAKASCSTSEPTIGADARPACSISPLWAAPWRAPCSRSKSRPSACSMSASEEIKGQEEIKEAGQLIREAGLDTIDYYGFVEGDDIGKGTVDVVVTEGFTGNIALKAAEGTARQMAEYLRAAMSRTWLAKLGYILAKGAFDRLREKMDPRKVNGGVFLGLNGIVIKSHGGTDAEGFAAAVDVGYDMARNGLKDKIEKDLQKYHARQSARSEGAEAAGSTRYRKLPMIRSVVRGFGTALPKRVVTNAELESMVETSDEWIVQRTGIKPALHRRRWRNHGLAWRRRRSAGARPRGPDGRRYRPRHLSRPRRRTTPSRQPP
jgi:glycerol-3-phosphate acyltransferase PlsX